jgi:multidrug resistance efflux pump
MKLVTTKKVFAALMVLILILVGCDSLSTDGLLTGSGDESIEASGVVEATEVAISSEFGGQIAEVFISEGDEIQDGDPLFRIDDQLLAAQRQQAEAAFEAAQANLEAASSALALAQSTLEAAQANVKSAEIQYQLELYAARLQEQPARTTIWDQDVPDEFDLPGWYFEISEDILAAEKQVQTTREHLEIERQNYQKVAENTSNADFQAAEDRLSEAQAAFLIADELINREVGQGDGREEIDDTIQTLYDTAEAELEAAQLAYDQILSDQSATDVLEARARLSVARERYEIALDNYYALLTGEYALTVQAAKAALSGAEASVRQAQAGVAQAEAGLAQAEMGVKQAQAALNLANLQVEKLTVYSSISGVVMTRNVEPGEVIQPGLTALTIAQIAKLTVTVYIPEDKYGRIELGDRAELSADSFPDETFNATVTRIADRAEYTPRNVQTKEDRQTTVYAVELSVDNPAGKLKPGMPTDVKFDN